LCKREHRHGAASRLDQGQPRSIGTPFGEFQAGILNLTHVKAARASSTSFDNVPVLRRPEIAMFKNVLIAADGSQLADRAIDQGLSLAKALGAKATAVTVTESWDALSRAALAQKQVCNPVAGYEERMAAAANRILWSVGEKAKKLGVACTTIHVKGRHAAEGIIETAREQTCDLIVIAAHGRRGLAAALIGSQANRVVTLSPVPVLVCR
jgi:nucleotide-binding universal stress UspA family protein